MTVATETDFLQRVHDSPEFFARHILGVQPFAPGEYFTDDQRGVFDDIRNHDRVAVYSAHGVGKTYALAVVILWFLHTRIPSIVVTTAGTFQQLDRVLWAEIRHLHQHSRVPLESQLMPRAPGISIGPKHFAEAISVDEPTAMLGRHSKNLLVAIDEGEGIKPDIFEAAERLQPRKTIVIGNPVAPEGPFYDLCTGAPDWTARRIDGRNHPNILAGEQIIPGAILPTWINTIIRKFGQDSPEYVSMVCGGFPDQSVSSLIWFSWVEEAQKRQLTRDSTVVISVDPARFGDDETAVVILDGPVHIETIGWRHLDLMETASKVLEIRRRWPDQSNTKVVVDTVGLGSGVADRLIEKGLGVIQFAGSHAPRYGRKNVDRRKQYYKNLRDEAWWGLRDAFQNGEIDLLDDPVLRRQLTSVHYEFKSGGLIEIEQKKRMKERGLESPDRADALVMAWWGRSQRPQGYGKPERRERTWEDEFDELTGLPSGEWGV